MKSLASRMRSAAEVLEEVSALYGYRYPEHANWTARDLRVESGHVGWGNPANLFEGIE